MPFQILLKCNMLYQIAKEEEKGVYLNFLINDSIYLLDESLNKILELKELETEMSNTAERERKPAQESQERTRLFHSQENFIQIDKKLSNENVSMLAFTSEQITAPFYSLRWLKEWRICSAKFYCN